MILRLIDGLRYGEAAGVDMAELLTSFAATLAVLFFSLPVHEYAHAWTAKKLGDNTAWMHGRLTLNPAKHLSLFGTLMILIAGFGYAKPVPVNPRNFKHYKKGMALTAVAGPLSNLIMAIGGCILFNLMRLFWFRTFNDLASLLTDFFAYFFVANVSLMMFNLIPFPPLDGSRILDLLLPAKWSDFIARYEQIFRWAVLLLLFIGNPISKLSALVAQGINAVVSLPFPNPFA